MGRLDTLTIDTDTPSAAAALLAFTPDMVEQIWSRLCV